MSGHVMRLNPSTRSYVRQGADGKFAPKVLSQTPKQPVTLEMHPANSQGVRVLSQK